MSGFNYVAFFENVNGVTRIAGQGIERDIATSADSLNDLVASFNRIIAGYVELAAREGVAQENALDNVLALPADHFGHRLPVVGRIEVTAVIAKPTPEVVIHDLDPDTEYADDRDRANDLLAIESGLNDWELGFVDSIAKRVLDDKKTLTSGQRQKADQILADQADADGPDF